MRAAFSRRLPAALCAAAVVGLLPAMAAQAAGGPVHGRYYDGTQTSSANFASLTLDFQVAGNGHSIKQLYLPYVSFTCPGGASAELLVAGGGTAAITTGNHFTITLATQDSYSPNPPNGSLVLAGSFGAGGTVSGSLAFTGSGPLAGCLTTIGWKGTVRPLVDHFVGHVTQGSTTTPFSFYRTVAPASHVINITVGPLTATCPAGSVPPSRLVSNLQSVYSLPVHPRGGFAADVFFTEGEAGHLSGHFPNPAHATGQVSYTGRDDCSSGPVSWSAHRVASRVLGPLNFG